MSLTHTFVSAVAEGTDPTLVGPTEWNAQHTVDIIAQDASPPGDVTIAAGYTALLMGLPVVIPSGFMLFIDSGGVLNILP